MQPREGDRVDARELRAAQGAVAVLLLGGFVFRLPWIVPVTAALTAAGAIAGPHANAFHVLYRSVVARRVRPSAESERAEAVRWLDGLAAALGGLATLGFLVGVGGFAWTIALVEAAVAAVAASTGVNAAVVLRDRWRDRH